MRLYARDNKSKSGLLSGLLDMCEILNNPAEITIHGLADISKPANIKRISFTLVNEEEPNENIDFFLRMYLWEYLEIMIETDPSKETNDIRVSKSLLRKVLDKWQSFDGYLLHNNISLDTYFSAKTFSQSGSFILSKKDLLILLSLKGNVTLREVMLANDDIEEVYFCIQKAIAHNIVKPKAYCLDIDYKSEIETLGYKINRFIHMVKAKKIADKEAIRQVLEKNKELLLPDFKDANCINITNDGIDLTDIMTSLSFSLDKDVMSAVGSSIITPLSYLFASTIIRFSFEGYFDELTNIVAAIELEINDTAESSRKNYNSKLEGKFA